MTRPALALLVVLLLLGSDVPRGGDAATCPTLDGEWLIMRVEYRGLHAYSEEDGLRMRFAVGGRTSGRPTGSTPTAAPGPST